MSIQSVSFYQQDQNYWQQAQAQSQASTADAALINVMADAMTTESKGKASIANGEALKRVNTQLTAAIQSLLQPSSSDSTSSSSSASTGSTSSSSSSGSSSSSPSPATGIGTAPLTVGTSLFTLGILQNGTITVSAGANMTTYTSTGTDTVANLINALNINLPTNANVTASLNSHGKLVITSRNTADVIVVGGSGTDAAAIGFGVGNNTFQPTQAASSAANSSSSSSASTGTSSSATGSSTSKSASSSKSTTTNSSPALQTFGTAASILSASGVSGNLIDMLA
jgi:hypothetical protein